MRSVIYRARIKLSFLINGEPESILIFGSYYSHIVLPLQVYDEVDSREIFDLIRDIRDPEHPNSLEELSVVQLDLITCNDTDNYVDVSVDVILECTVVSSSVYQSFFAFT